METVTISPKFQVVIPKPVREALALKAGEKAYVLEYDNRIEFIPKRRIRDMRGFLKGIDTRVLRDRDRL